MIAKDGLKRRARIGSLILVFTAAVLCRAARTDVKPSPPGETYWAFRTPAKPPVPAVQNPKLKIQNPIDSFVLAKLHEKGLTFAPPADNRTLVRRAAFDLTGLPPDPEQLDEPYEKAVERLLSSPQYGERWGRHWLDVVRYGETDGGEHNYERFNAWPYRDYVIDALNRDLPYNEFVRDQVAGDLLHPGDRQKFAATGFLVAGPWDQVSAVLNKDPLMRKTARMDELDDMVTSTSATFLGLTVSCARCHDHKFDPIPQKDYYRMAAAFSGAGFGEKSVAGKEEQARYDTQAGPLRAELGPVREELAGIEERPKAALLHAKYVAFEGKRKSNRRMPVNPIYNREAFAPLAVRYWRMEITGAHRGKPVLDHLELRPAGKQLEAWRAPGEATTEKPVIIDIDLGRPEVVQEVVWSTDTVTGKESGTPILFRFLSSDDGKTWRTAASNLDHVGSVEVELPDVTDEELAAALPSDKRERRAVLKARETDLQTKLSAIPTPAKIYAVSAHAPEPVSLLKRGNVATPIEPVSPGALTCVSQLPQDLARTEATDAERRIALADWIASPRNPLTARVIVNRVWYYHFGTGIVNTPSDFGINGDRPSHPELLDWLATSFMEHGWSLKWLHRQIMTSQAYRQSSHFNAAAHRVDAANRLLWRMPLRRMDAETTRDSILKVAGSLDLRAGGPSFPLHEKAGRGAFIYHTLDNDGPAVWRRAVYRFVVRGGDQTLLDSFDCPDPSVATPQRSLSNTPVQALALMNNAFVLRQAGLFAKRLERERPGDKAAQVERAFLLAFGRRPKSTEFGEAVNFLKTRPLALYCRALLNANEFLYTL